MELLHQLVVVLVLCSVCSGPVLSMMFGGGCPIFFCNKSCFNGYKRDFRGCKMCQCRFGSQKTGTGSNTGSNTGNFAQANYRPVILIPIKCKKLSCTTTCSNGRQRDSKGCETCTCKNTTNTNGGKGKWKGNTGNMGMMGTMGNMGMMNNMGNMGMVNNMGNMGMMNNMGNMGMMNNMGNMGMMGKMGMMGNMGNMGMMNNMGNMGNMGMMNNFNRFRKGKRVNNGLMMGNMGMMGGLGIGGLGMGGMGIGGFHRGFNNFNMGFSRFSLNAGSGFLSVPCPIGIPKWNCHISPCLNAKCPMNPLATCVESYCGGCHAAFYFNKKRIFC